MTNTLQDDSLSVSNQGGVKDISSDEGRREFSKDPSSA